MELTCRIALTLSVINSLIFTDSAFVVHNVPSSLLSRQQGHNHQRLPNIPYTDKTSKMGGASSRIVRHFKNGEDTFGDSQRGGSPPPVLLYGESRETWTFNDQNVEGVQIVLKNEGYPVYAEVDLWEGPYYTPQRMEMYSENGQLYPFCAIVETPNGQHAIGISNNGKLMDRGRIIDPIIAGVKPDNSVGPTTDAKPDFIEGGSVQSFTFPPSVSSVRILLQTEGFPMDATVELLQGDNQELKQVVNVFSEDGMKNPLFTMMSTPGKKSIIRVLNKGAPHFPGIIACVEPYLIDAVDENAESDDETTVSEASSSSKDSHEDQFEHVHTELVEEEPVQQTNEMHEQHGFSSYARTFDQPGHPTFAEMYGQNLRSSKSEPTRYPSETQTYKPHRSPLETEMYDSARARFEDDIPQPSIYDNAPPPMYEDLMYDDTYAHIYDAPMSPPDYNRINEDHSSRKGHSYIQDVAYERVQHTDIYDDSPPSQKKPPTSEEVSVDVVTSLFRQFWE